MQAWEEGGRDACMGTVEGGKESQGKEATVACEGSRRGNRRKGRRGGRLEGEDIGYRRGNIRRGESGKEVGERKNGMAERVREAGERNNGGKGRKQGEGSVR